MTFHSLDQSTGIQGNIGAGDGHTTNENLGRLVCNRRLLEDGGLIHGSTTFPKSLRLLEIMKIFAPDLRWSAR